MCKSYICSLNLYVFLNVFAVEAYAASWIEITRRFFSSATAFVEAYAASWIEISKKAGKAIVKASRLTQPRGLKSIRNIYSMRLIGRGLRSLVDWNMDIK